MDEKRTSPYPVAAFVLAVLNLSFLVRHRAVSANKTVLFNCYVYIYIHANIFTYIHTYKQTYVHGSYVFWMYVISLLIFGQFFFVPECRRHDMAGTLNFYLRFSMTAITSRACDLSFFTPIWIINGHEIFWWNVSDLNNYKHGDRIKKKKSFTRAVSLTFRSV